MYLRTRTWAIISVVCLLAAIYFWRLGEERSAREQEARRAAKTNVVIPLLSAQSNTTVQAQPVAVGFVETNGPVPYRVSNTKLTMEELVRSDAAVLLRNALIDATSGVSLPIPAHLRVQGETKSYVVQARGTTTDDFRNQLTAAGAEIVSYVPNNAYLVRVSSGGAEALRALPQVQAVIAWEPYFKLVNSKLLALAVEQKPLPIGHPLTVVAFPGEEKAATEALRDLGVTVMRGSPSPFGTQLVVHSPPEKLVDIVQVDMVQAVEPVYRRGKANDLARTRVRVSTNTTVLNNHLGLTGLDCLGNPVRVGVNDTGVDERHPDLQGRVFPFPAETGIDVDGHGTHVAGTIAGNGTSKPLGPVPGSTNTANFRGMAPLAEIVAQPIDILTGPLKPDTELQATTVSNRAFISNNSWGYLGAYDYTFASASWDAAVRDSVPGQEGPQSVTYVFSAGNDGFGADDGSGGLENSITAPATGKNVITVGAVEQPRFITNEFVINGVTNMPFLTMTDSDNQVARFSSRGNVGPGVEGVSGRFKPDVVAPGVFVASSRAAGWTSNLNITASAAFLTEELVPVGETNYYFFFGNPDAIEARIRITPNGRSPIPFPTNTLYIRQGDLPPPSDDVYHSNSVNYAIGDGIYYIGVGNNFNQDVYFDIQVVVVSKRPFTPADQELINLNNDLRPDLRYESGTSMSAPVVSGMLALLPGRMSCQPIDWSPASQKALLINGARSIGQYTLEANRVRNHQGWGMVNFTNTMPLHSPLGLGRYPEWPVQVRRGDGLVTGQSDTRIVSLSESVPELRITLVWTDPPGNPSVSAKLVNDLDLIVTNLSTGQIYVGNVISGDFSSTVDGSNIVSSVDLVNNVENVFIRNPLGGTNYSVTVRARRVNVNAVTSHSPTGVAQDYALVVSCGNPELPATFTVAPPSPVSAVDPGYPVITLSNSVPAFGMTVGGNPPFWSRPNSNGIPSQWRFFVFQNTNPPVNTNVAFFTFLTPNLSRPRASEEADIDLYVSTNPALTNLDANAIATANHSRKRGGTEAVVFTGANTAEFYYIGVKSEDQQAAQFGLFGFAGPTPFSEEDTNGAVTVYGLALPVEIPDGSSEQASGVMVFAYCLQQIEMRNVVVTNMLTHQNGGDLFGQLEHNGAKAILNNHRGFEGTVEFVYDDSNSGQIVNSTPSDGPDTLRNFWGMEGLGAWQLLMVDDALAATGRVETLILRLEPVVDTNDTFQTITVLPNRWFYTVVSVPPDAISLDIGVVPDRTVNVYVSRNSVPDDVIFDHFAQFAPPGGTMTITPADTPPLSAGLYVIGVFNPNVNAALVRLKIRVGRALNPALTNVYNIVGPIDLVDDAVTSSLITVTNLREVVDLRVGVRIEHQRASDLVVSLVSPAGTRVILAENRGGDSQLGYGAGSAPNFVHTVFTDDTNLTMTPIKFGTAPFTNSPSPNPNSLVTAVPIGPPIFSGFEDPNVPCNTQLNINDIVDGWEVFAGSMDLLCTGPRGTAYFGRKWLELNGVGPGMIARRVPTVAGSDYQLSFAYSKNPLATNAETWIEINRLSNSVVRFDAPNSTNSLDWRLHSTIVRGSGGLMDIGFRSRTPGNAGMYIDNVQLVQVRIRTNLANFFLPEEPLREVRGENAYGIWRLDVLDNRVGMPQAQLLDWYVDFDFASARTPTVVLTNGQCYTNRLEGPAVQYFRIDVPVNATRATNTFTASGDLSMSADSTSLPTGFAPPDDYAPVNGTNGTLVITTADVPPLRVGRSYFVALRNTLPINTNGLPSTNAFTFCVDFDQGPTNDLSGAISLTNNACIRSSIESTNLISYYIYDASPNAVAVFFNLVALDGNADLFVKRGLPLPFPGNGLESRNTGTTSEHIAVGSGQIPGRWFIGVLNNHTTNVNYTLCVTELTNYVTVTDSMCWTNGLAQNDTHYYRFAISNDTGRAEFRTFNATGNIDLYVRRAPPAGEFNFDYASERNPSGDEFIAVDLTSTPMPLRPGDWYAAVVNNGPIDVTYCIELKQFPYFDPSSIQLFITNGWTDTPPPARYMDLTLVGPEYLRYQIEYSDTLTDDPASWQPFTDLVSGQPIRFGPGSSMYTYRDTPLMVGNPPGLVRMRFYRVRVVP